MSDPTHELKRPITEYRKQWLNDLRSGEYRQTEEALRSDEGFCCLGVACESVGEDFDVVYKNTEHGHFYFYKEDLDESPHYGHDVELPYRMHELVEEPDYEDLDRSNVLDCLMKMNDSGKTFWEIADWLERMEFGKKLDRKEFARITNV